MKILLGAASTVIIIAGLVMGASLLIPIVFALFLAVLCFPSVSWLEARRVPRPFAVALTAMAVLVLLAGPGLLITATVREFATEVPAYQARLTQIQATVVRWVSEHSEQWLPEDQRIDTTLMTRYFDPAQAFDFLVNTLSNVVSLLSASFLVVLVAAFMLLEGSRRTGAATVPGPMGRHLDRIIHDMQIYLQVKTIVSLGTGLAAGLWCAVLGVDFAMLWGLLAFLLNYIPNLGSIVAAVPPGLVALIQLGPAMSGLLVVGYVGLNTIFGSVLEPFLLGRQLRFSPLAVVLAVIIWGWMWGLAGALLAMPMTMLIKIVLEQSDDLRWVARLLEGSTPGADEAEPAA